jgi:osmotically inducible protein OsmC
MTTELATPPTPSPLLFTAVATASAGRDGRVRSDDGALDVALSAPTALGGRDDASASPGTNPEQLFAAGYAACFGSAIEGTARRRRVAIGTVDVVARVGIGSIGGGAYGLTVELTATVPDVDRETAELLLREADRICPYSNALRGNVPVTLRLA